MSTIRFPVRDTGGNVGYADLVVSVATPPPPPPPPPTGGIIIADLGDLAGDPNVAPIKMGTFVASASGDPYGSNSIRVVYDPTGKWGRNVVEIDYPKLSGYSPDVNRSFEDMPGSPTVGLGEKMVVELEVLPLVDDPLRYNDQRKLTYFKTGTWKDPNGKVWTASTFVLNTEGQKYRISLNDPMYKITGTQKIKVHRFGGGGGFRINEINRIRCELHMNTQGFDALMAAGQPGDGRIIVDVNGVRMLDLQNVCIMDDLGGQGKVFNKFEVGKQWQASGVTTTEMRDMAWFERRYFGVARIIKL